jgi:hypothetical protein
MVRYIKQISPSKYYQQEYEVESVHDEHVIDRVLKCKVKWVGYEEQTWEPSYRIKHTDAYRNFKMQTDPLFKNVDKVAKRRKRKIFYQVQDIIARRVHEGVIQYFVLWKGYPREQGTWEPLSHLTNCQEILDNFRRKLLARCFEYFKNPPTQNSPFSATQQQKQQRQ